MTELNEIRTLAADIFDSPDLWLSTPNSNLGGMTPNALIETGTPEPVTNLLRLIRYVGSS